MTTDPQAPDWLRQAMNAPRCPRCGLSGRAVCGDRFNCPMERPHDPPPDQQAGGQAGKQAD